MVETRKLCAGITIGMAFASSNNPTITIKMEADRIETWTSNNIRPPEKVVLNPIDLKTFS
jgi:hypothetical protein